MLTFGDNIPLVALGALPLNTQVTGGIIQALIVFKQSTAYQVTGDSASTSNPLTINGLNVNVGTLSPNAIATTSKGLASHCAIDGIRVIGFNGNISDPVGFAARRRDGDVNIQVPSRAAMACNADTLRNALRDFRVQGSLTPNTGTRSAGRAGAARPPAIPALLQPYL